MTQREQVAKAIEGAWIEHARNGVGVSDEWHASAYLAMADAAIRALGGAAQVEVQTRLPAVPEPATHARELAVHNAVTPAKNRRGSRLPAGWMPSPETVARIKAQFPGVDSGDLSYEHEKFTDFWNAKTGAAATKLDWEGTWRNWMRRAFENRRQRVGQLAHNDQKIANLQAMKEPER